MRKAIPLFIFTLIGLFALLTLNSCRKKKKASATATTTTITAAQIKALLLGKWVLTDRDGKKVDNGKVEEIGDSTAVSIEFLEDTYTVQYLKTSDNNLWHILTEGKTENFSGTYDIIDEGKSITLKAPSYTAGVMAKWVGVIGGDDSVRKAIDTARARTERAETAQTSTTANSGNTSNITSTMTDRNSASSAAIATIFAKNEAVALGSLFPNNAGQVLVSLGKGLWPTLLEIDKEDDSLKTALDKLGRIFYSPLNKATSLEKVKSELQSYQTAKELKLTKVDGEKLVKSFEADSNKVKAVKALAQQDLIKNFTEGYDISFSSDGKQMTLEAKDTRYLSFDTSAKTQRKIGTKFIFTKK